MEKRGLGRGLSALIADTMAGEDASLVREVPVDHVKPNPYQPRREFDAEKMNELTMSIKEHGVLQPVLVRRIAADEYELIAGERRLRAVLQAGLKTIPVIVKEYANAQALEVALIENIQREDISPVDAALAYKRLMDEFGHTQQQIADRVGKSQPAIANLLRLLALPDSALESLRRGEITEGHARALLQFAPEAQHAVLADIKRRRLSVRETEKLAREMRNFTEKLEGKTLSEPPQRDPNHVAIEEALQVALGTKVTIRRVGDVRRLEIEFYSDDELEGLVERIIGNDK